MAGFFDNLLADPTSAQGMQNAGTFGGLQALGAALAQAGAMRPVGAPGPTIGDAFGAFGAGRQSGLLGAMKTQEMQRSLGRESAWRDAASGAPTTPEGMRLYSSIPEKNRAAIFAMGPEQGLKAWSAILSQRPVAVSPGQTLVGNDGPGARVPYTDQDFQYRRAGAPRTTVSMDMRAETEFEKAYGKAQAETAIDVLKAGDQAQNTIETVRRMREVRQGLQTGRLSGAAATATGIAQAMGVSPEILKSIGLPENAAPSEIYQQLSSRLAMSLIGPGGLPANNFSEADRKFVMGAVPNLLSRPETNKAGEDALERVAQRNQEARASWNAARAKKVPFDSWQSQWAEHVNKNPLFAGATPAPIPPLDARPRPTPRATDGAQPPPAPRRVTTQQEFMMLPRGARFIDPEGQERVKP
jgi:hypothetical protein